MVWNGFGIWIPGFSAQPPLLCHKNKICIVLVLAWRADLHWWLEVGVHQAEVSPRGWRWQKGQWLIPQAIWLHYRGQWRKWVSHTSSCFKGHSHASIMYPRFLAEFLAVWSKYYGGLCYYYGELREFPDKSSNFGLLYGCVYGPLLFAQLQRLDVKEVQLTMIGSINHWSI